MPSAYLEKNWKRGGKAQKIGPVNNGEDEAGNAVACGWGDETGTFARCHGKLRVRKSSVEGCCELQPQARVLMTTNATNIQYFCTHI